MQILYETAIRGLKMVAVQVQQDIRQHSSAQKSILAIQRAQNVGNLPKSRHSTFHFITIQIRVVLAEFLYKIMRQSWFFSMSISAKVLDKKVGIVAGFWNFEF